MTNQLLKLYRVKSTQDTTYGETETAVVYAFSPEDALEVLAEAFRDRDIQAPNTGYLGDPANPYEVLEEVSFERGLVLAYGEDG